MQKVDVSAPSLTAWPRRRPTLYNVTLSRKGETSNADVCEFEGEFGRLRGVVEGPDGFLYFTTSNRDGRGSPRAGDDKILRIVP